MGCSLEPGPSLVQGGYAGNNPGTREKEILVTGNPSISGNRRLSFGCLDIISDLENIIVYVPNTRGDLPVLLPVAPAESPPCRNQKVPQEGRGGTWAGRLGMLRD